MKERLIQLLDLEQITPSKFADVIGVQRSSVSHVLSGRNKPSYDFLYKTLTAFPGLNAEWLMLGKGTMYEQMGRGVTGSLFEAPSLANQEPNPVDRMSQEADRDLSDESEELDSVDSKLANADKERPTDDIHNDLLPDEPRGALEITQVLVFFNNDTFKTYKPSK